MQNEVNGSVVGTNLDLFQTAVTELNQIDAISPKLGCTPYSFFLRCINPDDEQALEQADTMLGILIKRQARMSLREFMNNTQLFQNAQHTPIPIARMWNKIIDAGADVQEPRIFTSPDGESVEYNLIHDLVRWVRDPLCKMMTAALLRAGADPNKPSGYGFSLVSVAIDGNNEQTVELLLTKGCSISAREVHSSITHCTNGAIPEVLRAAGISIESKYMADMIVFNLQHINTLRNDPQIKANEKMIAYAEEQLLKTITTAADLNWRGDSSEEWPLQVAIDLRRADLVQKFLDRGAVVFPGFRSNDPNISKILDHWRSRYDWKEALLRNNGSYYMLHDVGSKYLVGDGVPESAEKAVAFFTKAADQGYAESQYILAMCIMNREGAPYDPPRAARYFHLAAKQLQVDALFYYGRQLLQGDGIPADPAQGFHYLMEAARREHNDAIYMVGYCYQSGSGVPQNYSEAAKWFTKSAQMNDADGMLSLGYLYANGLGVPNNRQLATDLFAASAAQGNADARNNLNICYQNGLRPNPRGLVIPQLGYCFKCGAVLGDRARFCTKCGKPV